MFKSKLSRLMLIVIAAGVVCIFSSSAVAEWAPKGPIKLMIGFKAGGGADTQARLIAEELEARHGWKIIPSQVTGKGGINLAKALKKEPNDGTAIGIMVTESLGYNLFVAKKSGLKVSDFTPLTTTCGFQMGICSKTSKGWKTIHDVFKAAKGGQTIRFGAMSPRLADVAYLLGKANGVEFNIVMAKGGKGVMNALNAGDIDVGFLAGIQAKAVAAGDLVNLASALSKPLHQTPEAPVITDLGIEFDAGGHFLFVAPGGMDPNIKKELGDKIAAVVSDPSTKAGGLIKKVFGASDVIKGEVLDTLVNQQYEDAGKLLKAVAQ